MQAVLKGDLSSFEELMKRYEGMVLSQARRAFSSSDEAEDFAQEVFLKAYESLSTFRGEAQFSTWLYQIARNLIIKSSKKKSPIMETLVETQVASHKADIGDEILRGMREESDKRLLQMLLSRLPLVYRKPIILHYFENRPLKEISADLNVKINTLKSHISRGKELLRKWWQHET
ncbi:putative RNA polymerase sigma factor SigW [Leptospira ryugenii]|uniref:Putative RNA polymerase sigma factor SigW n=2 Tax=Leptospira ryugenii TaxID=1917863 RepID=A0A2P2E3T7_9LEPT|nr:RNA polymerase sigma factor [Leptospira ryugenii]GBF51553.1 putative RNA polymerase sigma factor SigW [Leptospira ryugenii]